MNDNCLPFYLTRTGNKQFTILQLLAILPTHTLFLCRQQRHFYLGWSTMTMDTL